MSILSRLSTAVAIFLCVYLFWRGDQFIHLHSHYHKIGMVSMETVDLTGTRYSDKKRECLGHHLVIDLCGCDPELIKEVATVEAVMIEAALAAKATIVASKFHQFSPSGVSGALILAESHLAIHTWPEIQGYCAVDIFTCGDTDNFAALDVLKRGFGAQRAVVVEIERGKQRSDNNENAVLFRENLDPLNGFRSTLAIKNILESVQSAYQKIEVYETTALGKMLTIDGIIQLTEYDNAGYHEMITHVPMQAHKNPRKILIIGGGDGGALAEIVKYRNVEEIVICDLDPMVAATAKKHFPCFAEAYNDPRVRAVYQDGSVLVGNFNDYFDVVIIDGTDFYGPAAPFACKAFYDKVSQAVKDDGIMVVQSESLFYDRLFIKDLYTQIGEVFPKVGYYNALVPSYPSGSIGFIFASKIYDPLKQRNKDHSFLNDLTYYTYDIHKASFAVPAFLKKMLG